MFTGALHLELEIEEKHIFELQTRSSNDKINTLVCKFKESTSPHFFRVRAAICMLRGIRKLYSEIITNNFCFEALSMQLALTLDRVEDL